MIDPKNQAGTWIPLMDFAVKKGVSLSTLRRHIKNNKVVHRVENGRYLLWDVGEGKLSSSDLPGNSTDRFTRLEQDLKKAREEIAELKTLIALYEENIPQERSKT